MSKRQLITESDIRSAAAQGQSILRVSEDAIITPLALDASNITGVRIEFIPKNEAPAGEVRIALAVTRQAFRMKRAVLDVLRSRTAGIREVEVKGDDDIAAAVDTIRAVVGGSCAFGIILDATGIRSAMICNRFSGARAVHAAETRHAAIARSRFDANVLTLGAEFLTPSRTAEIVRVFLDTRFAGTQ